MRIDMERKEIAMESLSRSKNEAEEEVLMLTVKLEMERNKNAEVLPNRILDSAKDPLKPSIPRSALIQMPLFQPYHFSFLSFYCVASESPSGRALCRQIFRGPFESI
jgi:hypothetical protein